MRAIIALALVAAASARSEDANVGLLWAGWKTANEVSYASKEEEAARRVVFEKNHMTIQHLNKLHAGKSDRAQFGLNKFADRTPAEMKRLRGTHVPASRVGLRVAKDITTTAPTTVDWRQKGVVAPVQNQGQCGSCWAFSATSNMESRFALKHNLNAPIKLAEQALVDCDRECGTYRGENGCDHGCEGGLMPNAFQYVMKNGQPAEQSYPYRAVDGQCHVSGLPSRVNISSWELVSQNEDQMAAYVAANGPVSVAVDASEWSFYLGGVMEYLCWGTITPADLDHGVVVVGYGATELGTKYWIIRNSWGEDWGESGYAKILRGDGFCGVNLFACSSIA